FACGQKAPLLVFDLSEQPPPTTRAPSQSVVLIQLFGPFQVGSGHMLKLERIIRLSEEPSVRSGETDAAEPDRPRYRDAGRQDSRRSETAHSRANSREMAATPKMIRDRDTFINASRERPIDRYLMIVAGMRHRADQHQFVSLLRNARQPFAKLN